MEALQTMLVNGAVVVGGLLLRFLAFVAILFLLSLPILAALYTYEAFRALRARRLGEVDLGGVRFRPGLIYTPSHTWLGRKRRGAVRLGLDDVAQRIVAGKTSVLLAPVGTRLASGDPVAAIRCGSHCASIPSPVEGIVVERNARLAEDPDLLHREPYRNGWMLAIRTTNGSPAGALSGTDAKEWLANESRELARFLEDRLGMAAADGGELTAPPADLLPEEAWREAARRFLKAA